MALVTETLEHRCDSVFGIICTEQEDASISSPTSFIAWNTIYIGKAVEHLRREGCTADDNDLKRIWPTRHRHINHLWKALVQF